MSDLRIIAEAAQGYLPLTADRGSLETALLMTRAAAVAGADAIKFQIVYVEELAYPGNVHFDIFRRLEMPTEDWQTVRDYAKGSGLEFIADVFGPRSLEVGRSIEADGYKIHSTIFFDHPFVSEVLAQGKEVFVSLGGIEATEVANFIERHGIGPDSKVTLLYGFQAEPTPMERNHLGRIPSWIAHTGLPLGFMDHSDGDGADTVNLSVLAMGMGVRIFEKHITLDRILELEDYVSALPPGAFAEYAQALRRLESAVGNSTLDLTEPERAYREKAIKRCVASHDMSAGTVVTAEAFSMIRPDKPVGEFDPSAVLGRELARDMVKGEPISKGGLK